MPASSTSSWLSGSPEMPAARLVTRLMPSTSMPASRAAIASSVVLIPTRSPRWRGPCRSRPGSRSAGRGTGRRRPRRGSGRPRGTARAAGWSRGRSGRRSSRPRSGDVPVRLMWSVISTGVPGDQVSFRPPQPLVSTIARQPAAAAVRIGWTTARDALALVEVGAAEEDQQVLVTGADAADLPGVAGDRGRVEAGQVGGGDLGRGLAERVDGRQPAGAEDERDVVAAQRRSARRGGRRPPAASCWGVCGVAGQSRGDSSGTRIGTMSVAGCRIGP